LSTLNAPKLSMYGFVGKVWAALYLEERHDVRPNVVVQHFKSERDVERDGRRGVALAPVDETVLDAEEERGAEGDCGKASRGERTHEGHDGGALVGLDDVVQGNVTYSVFGEQD